MSVVWMLICLTLPLILLWFDALFTVNSPLKLILNLLLLCCLQFISVLLLFLHIHTTHKTLCLKFLWIVSHIYTLRLIICREPLYPHHVSITPNHRQRLRNVKRIWIKYHNLCIWIILRLRKSGDAGFCRVWQKIKNFMLGSHTLN